MDIEKEAAFTQETPRSSRKNHGPTGRERCLLITTVLLAVALIVVTIVLVVEKTKTEDSGATKAAVYPYHQLYRGYNASVRHNSLATASYLEPSSNTAGKCEVITLHQLYERTGFETFAIEVDGYENNPLYLDLKLARGYDYEDVVDITPGKLDNYEQMKKTWYTEHLHEHDEIRYLLDGSVYFEVRDDQDRWIRVHAQKGDLIVMPSGLYHRFHLDSDNYVKVKRLFQGSPVWKAYFRHDNATDDTAWRKAYVAKRESIREGKTKTCDD